MRCKRHNWKIIEMSNAIQIDDMGYPLRLCIYECTKCGKSEQRWIDVYCDWEKEVENGKSFIVKWSEVNNEQRRKEND